MKKKCAHLLALMLTVVLALASMPVGQVLAMGPLPAYPQFVSSTNGTDTITDEFAAQGEPCYQSEICLPNAHYTDELSLQINFHAGEWVDPVVTIDGTTVTPEQAIITGYHGGVTAQILLNNLRAVISPSRYGFSEIVVSVGDQSRKVILDWYPSYVATTTKPFVYSFGANGEFSGEQLEVADRYVETITAKRAHYANELQIGVVSQFDLFHMGLVDNHKLDEGDFVIDSAEQLADGTYYIICTFKNLDKYAFPSDNGYSDVQLFSVGGHGGIHDEVHLRIQWAQTAQIYKSFLKSTDRGYYSEDEFPPYEPIQTAQQKHYAANVELQVCFNTPYVYFERPSIVVDGQQVTNFTFTRATYKTGVAFHISLLDLDRLVTLNPTSEIEVSVSGGYSRITVEWQS